MSLTMEQMIMDTKRLAGRLKERENMTDTLINETQAINKQLETSKQYEGEVNSLNKTSCQPRAALISSIQHDIAEMKDMQTENQRLQMALDEHRRALEHIMSKYRQQVQGQIWHSRIDFKAIINKRQQEVIRQQAEKINEMASIMHRAIYIDDENAPHPQADVISQLIIENKGLREMLGISRRFGNEIVVKSPILTEDKDVQTDVATSNSSANAST